MHNPLIFLTGCINPGGMTLTKLQNPDERKAQYINAINFYLNKTSLKILFVENSGVDISDEFEAQILNHRLEVLTFNGNNYNKLLGKGYGEMIIIEYAVENSKFLRLSNFILKITGRYKVLNINSFLQYFDQCKFNLNIDLKFQLTYSDSRFWSCDYRFLKDFILKYKEEVNDSQKVYFEHILCKATLDAIVNNYSHSLLKIWPRYSGVSGTKNINEYETWIWWFAKNIRHKLRYYFMKST